MSDREEYTPTTEDVRNDYAQLNASVREEATVPVGEEFDRWLAAHDREVREATKAGIAEMFDALHESDEWDPWYWSEVADRVREWELEQ